MHREIIDGDKLKDILTDFPKELQNVKVEVIVKPYGDQDQKVMKLLEKIQRRVDRTSYLGKEKEVFFLEEDELEMDLRRALLQSLKDEGYEARFKEGARGTTVLTLAWVNKK